VLFLHIIIPKFTTHIAFMTKRRKTTLIIVTALLFAAFILIFSTLTGPGIYPRGWKNTLYIPTGSTYSQALDSIYSTFDVRGKKLFEWVARMRKYPGLVKPGRYVFDKKTSFLKFLSTLRTGRQTPVNVTFSNVRTLYQVAARVGDKIEADSTSLIAYLLKESNYSADGFRKETVISVFIPNTYELYWNTQAPGFFEKMLKEYRKFWNGQRLRKAGEERLTPVEVSTVASIVDEETIRPDEKARIAGVYLNRLKRGMALQADPTIKFALNDFTLTRILYKHLQVDSPYNTYKHPGLPPGPINCPSVESIDAVLDAEKHDYIYFVAKADNSGYHVFSRTLTEHNHYASEYQKYLDKRKITN